MSIKSEIDRLAAIKEDLKAALAEKGQTVGEVFSTYPDAVRAIQTGGESAAVSVKSGVFEDPRYGFHYIDADGNPVCKLLDSESFTLNVKIGSYILPILPVDFKPNCASGGLSSPENSGLYTRDSTETCLLYVSGDGEINATF